MRVATNAFWLSVCRILADALSFALFAAIGRAFGPTGAGEYSYALALATLLMFLCSGGLEEYAIPQYTRAAPADRPRVWRQILSAQAVQLGVMLALFGLFLLAQRKLEARVSVILALAAFFVAWGISRVLFIPATASLAMVRPAFTELACRVAAIVVALGAWLLASPPLPVMLIGFPLAAVLLLWLAARNAGRHGARFPGIHPASALVTLRQSAPFAGSSFLNQFYARVDLLVIAALLGSVQVGLYATDLKVLEVGLLPVVLLGTAAYPLLSRLAGGAHKEFSQAARDLVRTSFLLSGWLAVAMCALMPLLVVPVLGEAFGPAVAYLPWFAALAIMKSAEVALYRLLYALQRQMKYLVSLLAGTATTIALNFALLPILGITGAVLAAICSVTLVAAICAWHLRAHLPIRALVSLVLRLAVALGLTASVFFGAREFGISPWANAVLACVAFPFAAFGVGLVLNPAASRLFRFDEPLRPAVRQ
ncbi:MAG: oligosaccharide flippase family protein [Steroidobacteraceae bacterium]|nr:oligosaccharide flippase family protein [Steroidobacteraceae bacterium]